MQKHTKSRRLFFAIMPNAETRSTIQRTTRDAVKQAGGRPVPPRNLHITVAFLGNIDADAARAVMRNPALDVSGFFVEFGRYWHSKRNRMLWLEPLTVPHELKILEKQLWQGLSEHGFVREERPYRPHVTLARNANPVPTSEVTFRWQVRSLSLVESITHASGSRYEPLHTWQL